MSKTSPYHSNVYRVRYQNNDVSLERWPTRLEDSGVLHTVLEGQTLQEISAIYFGDSGRWADIADINNIHDPFNIPVNSSIIIPI